MAELARLADALGRDGRCCGAAVLPGLAPVAGIVLLGLSAAPMFPLLTLTTRDGGGHRLGRPRHRFAERSFGCGISDPTGADRTAHRPRVQRGREGEPEERGVHGISRLVGHRGRRS